MDTPPTISPAFLSFLSPDPQHCFVEQKICVCPRGELRQREELQRRIMALAVDTWQPFFVSVEQRTVEVRVDQGYPLVSPQGSQVSLDRKSVV